MSTTPSVKGSVLAGHAEVLIKYLAENAVEPDVLAERFPEGELDLLSKPIHASSWYDVRIYQRVLEFLRDYEGYGSNAYLIAAGERSAQKLIEAGLYQQLEYLSRTQVSAKTDVAERHRAFGRDLRLLTTLTPTIFNFVKIALKEDPEHPDRWMLEYSQAEHFPEVVCWTTQGFCNRMAALHGAPDLWRWERPSRDIVLFRMTRPA